MARASRITFLAYVGRPAWWGPAERAGWEEDHGRTPGPVQAWAHRKAPASSHLQGRVTRQRPCDGTGGSWAWVRGVTGQPAPSRAGGFSRVGTWGSQGRGPSLAQAHLQEVVGAWHRVSDPVPC